LRHPAETISIKNFSKLFWGGNALATTEKRPTNKFKSAVFQMLDQMGLLLPVFRGVEFIRASGAEKGADSADGLPLPPADLQVLVAGVADSAWFLEGGQLAEDSIRAVLDRAGAPLSSQRSILDFGCGCGRVLRRWRGLNARVHGVDYNQSLVRWCQKNLPFAEVSVNGLKPPLPYDDASFDFIYSFSVFTHLPIDTQFAWRDELRRVMRPGGHLLLSIHGDAYLDQLTVEERSIYDSGSCVVRWPKAAGANLCSTFHSPAFVRERLAEGWELIEHIPRGALCCRDQDLVLLRKPQA
jgi:SAM-dependent methyltransferase